MKVILFKLCVFVFILFSLNAGYAQLDVRSIGFNSDAIEKTLLKKRSEGDTILLPFWDDFSFSDHTPSNALWSSFNGILINNTLSNSPPSINVATFDGYNSLGYPYSTDGLLHDTTDMMTSRRIDLSVVKVDKRDSVVFSFYWQKGGKTDLPEDEDLLVDFGEEFEDFSFDPLQMFERNVEEVPAATSRIENGQFRQPLPQFEQSFD